MAQTAEPTIDIQTRCSRQRLYVTVANNGLEIDEATRSKIFQPSFTTKKERLSFGLGLRLAIIGRIVSGYGGTVAVISDQDKTILGLNYQLGDTMEKLNIICVDDHREVLSAVLLDLEPLSRWINIEDCESADEALDLMDDLDAQGSGWRS